MALPEVKVEAIRLRVEERRSLRDIRRLTGASKGILSLWLRPYPLTRDEQQTLQRTKRALQPNTPSLDRGPPSQEYIDLSGQQLDRDHKGRLAEVIVAARLARNGFHVYKPLFDGGRFDWLVRNPKSGNYSRIQVKWARKTKSGSPIINLRCRSGKTLRVYSETDTDYVVGYDLFTDAVYIWEVSEIKHLRGSVALTDKVRERWDKIK